MTLCVYHASQATQKPLHMPLVYNPIFIQYVQKQIKKIEIVFVKNCGPNHNLELGIDQKMSRDATMIRDRRYDTVSIYLLLQICFVILSYLSFS